MKKLALVVAALAAAPLLAQTPTPTPALNYATVLPMTGDSDTATLQKLLTEQLKAHAAAVTPADGADLPHAAVELWVGVGGNIKVDMLGGETGVVFTAVPIGRFPYAVKRVYATGTTATTMIALY